MTKEIQQGEIQWEKMENPAIGLMEPGICIQDRDHNLAAHMRKVWHL